MTTKITSFSKDNGEYKVSFYSPPSVRSIIYFDNETMAYVSDVTDDVCTLKKCYSNMDYEDMIKVGAEVRVFLPHLIV